MSDSENLVYVRLNYRAGDMMPGVYKVTPAQAAAIQAVNQAIRELLAAFGVDEPSWNEQLYGLIAEG